MKKKWMAGIMAALFSMSILAACGGGADAPSGGSDADKGEGGDVVVVGTNPAFDPFEFQDSEGNIEGFDIDLMTAIGEDQGFTIEVKSMEFDALTGAIQNGSIDVIASGMSITPERLKQVNFSDPYMDASLGIVIDAANEEITTKDDLKGKVVCAQIGTTGASEATKLVEEGGAAEVQIFDTFNTCIQALLNGSVDAIINDMPVNDAYMAKNPDNVKILGDPFVADYYGIAVAQDNEELLEKLNTGLKNIIESGKYEEICVKYELEVPESIVNGTANVPTAEDAA